MSLGGWSALASGVLVFLANEIAWPLHVLYFGFLLVAPFALFAWSLVDGLVPRPPTFVAERGRLPVLLRV